MSPRTRSSTIRRHELNVELSPIDTPRAQIHHLESHLPTLATATRSRWQESRVVRHAQLTESCQREFSTGPQNESLHDITLAPLNFQGRATYPTARRIPLRRSYETTCPPLTYFAKTRYATGGQSVARQFEALNAPNNDLADASNSSAVPGATSNFISCKLP